MAIITIAGGRQFTTESDETLLDAALRAGVVLPHSCRTGRCGSCKSQVHHGESTIKLAEAGLSDAERDDRWLLTCARTASTDMQLDVADLSALNLPAVRTLPCRIGHIEPLNADVLKVMLRLPPQQPLLYQAGQYVDVIGPGGLKRSYSIANAANATRTEPPAALPAGTQALLSTTSIELHVKRAPDGLMSRYWFEQAKGNDLLRLRGAQGTSVLHDVAGRDLVFLATGTGLAPIKAMLESLSSMAADSLPASVSLYWGARLPEDLYWDPAELQATSTVPLRFCPVVSRSLCWDGATGHVQDACVKAGHDFSRTVVFACGSDNMIASARNVLVAAGLPPSRFHSDAFVCSA